MGLLRKLHEYRQTRRIRALVRDKLAEPYPQPSAIADYAAGVPRAIKRAHKLEVRRGYRRTIKGTELSSVQRQILAEQSATRVYAEAEADAKRAREEDELYGVTGVPS